MSSTCMRPTTKNESLTAIVPLTRRAFLARMLGSGMGLLGATLFPGSLLAGKNSRSQSSSMFPVTRVGLRKSDINVLDFGADSTGLLDSATAIQQALRQGRPVFFPPGIFSVGASLMISNNAFLYADPGTAVIRASLDLASGSSLLQTNVFSGALGSYENNNITFNGVGFDGNDRHLDKYVALIRLAKIDGLVVKNCTFTKHKFSLLSILGCKNVSITGCSFSRWGKDEVSKEGGPALYMSANFKDNTETRFVTVEANTFYDGEWAAIYVYGKKIVIRRNEIRRVKESGIFCFRERAGDPGNADCEDLDVINNDIADVRQKYISATGMEIGALRATIRGNRITNTSSSGIKTLDPGQDILIQDNTITDTVRDPSVFQKHGQIDIMSSDASLADPENIQIIGNIIRDNSNPKISPAAIAVRAARGYTPIGGLRIINNDVIGGYAQTPISIAPGMLKEDSIISGNVAE